MKRLFLALGLLSLLKLHSASPAQTSHIEIPLPIEKTPTGRDSFIPYARIKRPKIALALSGGGARGLAQIGVLKVFERNGIPIDGIAGTSIGAIIGGLTALGYTAAQIESLAYEIRWDQIINDTPERKQLFLSQKEERASYILQLRLKGMSLDLPSAYTAGQSLTALITDLVLNAPTPLSADFNQMAIPFRALAADIVSGKKVIFDQGSLIQALRASMTIPLLISPVQHGDALLVDGGVLQNLPVDEARELDADLVIAIDTSSKLRGPEMLQRPWEIADQVTTIMQKGQTEAQLDSADIAIQPDLEGFTNTDFNPVADLIKAGERAAENALPGIESILSTIDPTPKDTLFFIERLSIEGCIHCSPSSIISKLNLDLPSLISTSQIIWAGQTIFQMGYFKNIFCKLDISDHHLIFEVEENPKIATIEIDSNRIFPDSTLLNRMETRPGDVIDVHRGRRDLKKIINHYRSAGYALANIENTSLINDTLKIEINEGIIGSITLRGNEHTRPFVILREIDLQVGDLFNTTKLKQGIDNIYSTGYFDGVRFDIRRQVRDYELIIQVIEQGHLLARMGLRYDLERERKGYLRLIDENIFGVGMKGSIMGLLGNRDRVVRGRLWSDRLFNSLLTPQFVASYERKAYHYYRHFKSTGEYYQSRWRAALSVGQQIRRLGTLSLQYVTEYYDLTPYDGHTPDESYALRSLTLRSVVDTRDRIPFPRSGKLHILEYETAGSVLGSEISYTKIFSSMESYYSLNDAVVVRPRIMWGTADLTTPFVKQFRLGGVDTFMGLPEEAWFGKRFLSLSGELRYRLPWPRLLETHATIRYDFGGVWAQYAKITTDDFKHGFGGIFSVSTPAGPIQVGYGRMSDGLIQVYFMAGFEF